MNTEAEALLMALAEKWMDDIYFWLDLSDEEEAMCARMCLKCTPESMIDAIRDLRRREAELEDDEDDGEDWSRAGMMREHGTYHAVGGRVS